MEYYKIIPPQAQKKAPKIKGSSRFGEALRIVQDNLDSRNFYAFNPGFDCGCNS